MDPELDKRLKALEEKIDRAMKAAESTRRWMFWTGIITIAVLVLPMIGLVFAIPFFLHNTVGAYQQLLNTPN